MISTLVVTWWFNKMLVTVQINMLKGIMWPCKSIHCLPFVPPVPPQVWFSEAHIEISIHGQGTGLGRGETGNRKEKARQARGRSLARRSLAESREGGAGLEGESQLRVVPIWGKEVGFSYSYTCHLLAQSPKSTSFMRNQKHSIAHGQTSERFQWTFGTSVNGPLKKPLGGKKKKPLGQKHSDRGGDSKLV